MDLDEIEKNINSIGSSKRMLAIIILTYSRIRIWHVEKVFKRIVLARTDVIFYMI